MKLSAVLMTYLDQLTPEKEDRVLTRPIGNANGVGAPGCLVMVAEDLDVGEATIQFLTEAIAFDYHRHQGGPNVALTETVDAIRAHILNNRNNRKLANIIGLNPQPEGGE